MLGVFCLSELHRLDILQETLNDFVDWSAAFFAHSKVPHMSKPLEQELFPLSLFYQECFSHAAVGESLPGRDFFILFTVSPREPFFLCRL